MSPFATAFRNLRIACGFRQAEFAARLGFEQSYISAIELGTKGPPTPDFVSRLVERLELSDDWKSRLFSALEESQRKIVLPSEASEEVYRLFNELRRQIGTLHPVQVELMQIALRLPASMSHDLFEVSSLPRRRRSEPNKKAEVKG
jgi:transcriptional regulator with XRE-family HTH domain